MLQVHDIYTKAPVAGCFVCAVTVSNSAKPMTKYTLYPCYFPPDEFENVQASFLIPSNPTSIISNSLTTSSYTTARTAAPSARDH